MSPMEQSLREALERAGHALASAASWMVPECDGYKDALAAADRARLAALTPEPPR